MEKHLDYGSKKIYIGDSSPSSSTSLLPWENKMKSILRISINLPFVLSPHSSIKSVVTRPENRSGVVSHSQSQDPATTIHVIARSYRRGDDDRVLDEVNGEVVKSLTFIPERIIT